MLSPKDAVLVAIDEGLELERSEAGGKARHRGGGQRDRQQRECPCEWARGRLAWIGPQLAPLVKVRGGDAGAQARRAEAHRREQVI